MAASIKVDVVSGSHVWSGPICLIDNSMDGVFKVVDKTLEELRKIRQPVVVVSIVGPYRSGKSYLMNRLADQKKGFELGNSIMAKTKGIWVWCLKHPARTNEQLLLLDTEGLGDVDKVAGSQNDIMLFLLTTLLSSCLVYNSRGVIDQPAIDNLKFVAEIAEKFKISSESETAEDDDILLGQYFPKFVWVVRDFTLKLEKDGKDITADDYLEDALSLRKGRSKSATDFNLTRRCIRSYFLDRRCFVFPPPASDPTLMVKLAELTASQMNISFLQASKQFTDYIITNAQPKNIGGIVMDGQKFAGLVNNYTDAIVTNKIPSIETVVITSIAEVNKAVVSDCIQDYGVAMGTLTLPSNDEKEFMTHHERCVDKVKNELKSRCVNLDTNEKELIKELMEGINEKFEAVKIMNEELSMKKCRDLLAKLTADIQQKADAEKYSVKGGYSQYEKDFGEACKKYLSTPGKGVSATKALQECVLSFSNIAKAVMLVDKALSNEARKREEEKIKEASEKLEKERVQKLKEESERLLAEQARRLTELERTMDEKLEEQRLMYDTDMKRLVRLLSTERDRLNKEGVSEDSEVINELLESLDLRDRQRQASLHQKRRQRSQSGYEPLYFVHRM